MKTPSASSFTRPRRALLAAGGSLAFFLLPFVLFHPEKKPVVPHITSKRSIEYLPEGGKNADPGLRYMLQRHDPRHFLFPGEKQGFALFRVRPDILEPDVSSGLKTGLPVSSAVSSPHDSMKPGSLPRSEAAFSAPLFVPSSLADASDPADLFAPAEGGTPVKFAPVIRSASGRILPDSRISAFSESEIQSLHPLGPTKLLVEPPSLPELPRHAGILTSCGVPRLDMEACRQLNRLLQKTVLPDHPDGPEVYSVYWLSPAVSTAFSAGLQEDKEEGPES